MDAQERIRQRCEQFPLEEAFCQQRDRQLEELVNLAGTEAVSGADKVRALGGTGGRAGSRAKEVSTEAERTRCMGWGLGEGDVAKTAHRMVV
eukprot:356215-Chlamydomonas_euryale.AAC.1